MNRQQTAQGSEPIAIVGVGCWLPGGITSVEALLDALRSGRDLITDIPPDRWSTEAFYDQDPLAPGKTYVRKGGFVEGVDLFDAGFFGVSTAEAPRMDPQQRMLLQTIWHALENAGQAPEEWEQSNAGVFLAMMNTNGYSQLKALDQGFNGLTAYDAMADAMSITAGRIAHFLGVEGPTMTLDTACSSSLVALHVARQSILSGDCDAAIVAGVNAILHPGIHITFSKVGLMSRSGRCAAFDASADGYIRGEGCVAVVLRRQSEAIARGDRILATIVGTAVNQDGRTPAMTAPNGRAQERVIRSALARHAASASDIGYLEAHGTGTPVGDPIEMSAIVNVYGPGRGPDEKLYVGSVKSNFGHIEAGAGLLGLVKASLSLHEGEIFPSLHFKELNPGIDLGHAPVVVPSRLTPWPRNSRPRMAGVNSFGYSGTNAHAILQEAPQPAEDQEWVGPSRRDRPELIVLSAKSNASLEELADDWVRYLEADDENAPDFADIAFTAATGRAHLSNRLAIVGSDKADAAAKLRAWREGRTTKGLASGQVRFRAKPRIALMFTGQGAQHPGMAAELYKTTPRFAEALDRVAASMDEHLGVPLKDVLFGPGSRTYLSNTRYVQPALFAVEYALADLLRDWGIEPDFVIGHSVGEITAAAVSGMLELDDAVRFVVARGRLMGELPEGGKMLAIATSVEQARRLIQGHENDVAVATVNAPGAVVVSGRGEVIEAVGRLAQEAGLRTTALDVSHAFHSPLMDPILDELSAVASSMRISAPRIPMISNVTGDFHTDRVEPTYWSNHVRQAVLFHAGVEKIVEAGATLLLEVGPNPALTPAIATGFDPAAVQPIPTLKRDGKDVANLLGALATLYVKGAGMNLERLFWSPEYRRVSLPLYPFRKDRHWAVPIGMLDRHPQAPPEVLPDLPELHPMLGAAVSRSSRRTVFETTFSTASPWTDHRVLGKTIFPGTAYLDMAARGFAALSGEQWRPVDFREVSFERPLLLEYRKPKSVRLILEKSRGPADGTRFMVVDAADEGTVYCQGQISAYGNGSESMPAERVLQERPADLQIGAFYGELRKSGLEYGAKFANVRELWCGEAGSGEALGRVAAQRGNNGERDPFANAVLLDGCAHVFGAALKLTSATASEGAYVPASIGSITLHEELPQQVWSQAKVEMAANGRAAIADIRVADDAGRTLAQFTGLELRHTSGLTTGKAAAAGVGTASTLVNKSRGELLEFLRPLPRPKRIREMALWLTAEIKGTLGQAADGLDLETLPPNTAFLEIGLDSLLVTELQRRIQEKLNFRFQPMQGLDYQTVDSMAEFLLDSVLSADLDAQPVAPPGVNNDLPGQVALQS
jgi:acyl transferase domain-containing protein